MSCGKQTTSWSDGTVGCHERYQQMEMIFRYNVSLIREFFPNFIYTMSSVLAQIVHLPILHNVKISSISRPRPPFKCDTTSWQCNRNLSEEQVQGYPTTLRKREFIGHLASHASQGQTQSEISRDGLQETSLQKPSFYEVVRNL